MGRNKKATPRLFREGKGNYRFRRFINGKDKEFNTGTTDKKEAGKILDDYLNGVQLAENQERKKRNPAKITNMVMETVNAEFERIPLDEAFEFWFNLSPDFSNTAESHQKQQKSWFQKFVRFCNGQGIAYTDEVDEDIAIRFSGLLLKEKYAPKTRNEYLAFLSGIFKRIDRLKHLPHRNPFEPEIIQYSKVPKRAEATHQPFEETMITAIMEAAAAAGLEWLDLFIVGSQTGMRLKDAALLSWNEIDGGSIEYEPEKTIRHGNKARVPVSRNLAMLLERRKMQNSASPYVNPRIAEFYQSSDWVTKKCQQIVVEALGKERTQLPKERRQRKKNGCIYSFHSFRTTFMSLLASKNVSVWDAMEMLGWETTDMVKLYTKMLQKTRAEMDKRNKELIDSLDELNFTPPPPNPKPERLWPTCEALSWLIEDYSNITIGKIYGISSVAVKKWLDKYGLRRSKRVCNNIVEEEEILRIREELQTA